MVLKYKTEYWEWVFYKNLIGAVILFPFVQSYLRFFLAKENAFATLLVLSLTMLFASWLLYMRRGQYYLIDLGIVVFLAAILFGFAVRKIDPIVTVWFINTALAILTFGYILAKHLFAQTERLFLKKWKEIIAGGLLATLLRITLAFAFLFFPLSLMVVLFTVSHIFIVAKFFEFK